MCDPAFSPRGLWLAALNIIFPLHCSICSSGLAPNNKYFLCDDCRKKIKLITGTTCPICGDGGYTSPCQACRKRKPHYTKARARTEYEGVTRELIHKFKYGGQAHLAIPLARLISELVETDVSLRRCELVVPVPLHSRKRRERGFNQSELLAENVVKRFRMRICKDELVRTVYNQPQINLDRPGRLKNVRGIFRVRRPDVFKAKRILLIDDVFTTGSTVNECSKVLVQAGAKEVSVLTVARGA